MAYPVDIAGISSSDGGYDIHVLPCMGCHSWHIGILLYTRVGLAPLLHMACAMDRRQTAGADTPGPQERQDTPTSSLEAYPASLSVSEAAEALGVSPATVRRYLAAGAIHGWRTQGGQRRITVQSIRDLHRRTLESIA